MVPAGTGHTTAKKVGMDVDDPANNRLISNLNTISKIIERLALVRLRQQITQSENFNQLQSAYRQHHSTETTLLNILNDAYGIWTREGP